MVPLFFVVLLPDAWSGSAYPLLRSTRRAPMKRSRQ